MNRWICLPISRRAWLILLVPLLLSACATASKVRYAERRQQNRVAELQAELKRRNALIEELREKNHILSSKLKRHPKSASAPEVPVPFQGTVQDAVAGGAAASGSGVPMAPPIETIQRAERVPIKLPPHSAPANVIETQVVAQAPVEVSSPAESGEHFLYSKVIDTYQRKKTEELRKSVQLLQKTYPQSVFLDNALYLLGMQYFESNSYSEAVRQFDELTRKYPFGNKTVSALFAKAVALKKMRRLNEAKDAFALVATAYPGSAEAARVPVEIRLLQKSSK